PPPPSRPAPRPDCLGSCMRMMAVRSTETATNSMKAIQNMVPPWNYASRPGRVRCDGLLVPRAGIEPARVAPVDFESTASTVPPPRLGGRPRSPQAVEQTRTQYTSEQLVIVAAPYVARQPGTPSTRPLGGGAPSRRSGRAGVVAPNGVDRGARGRATPH